VHPRTTSELGQQQHWVSFMFKKRSRRCWMAAGYAALLAVALCCGCAPDTPRGPVVAFKCEIRCPDHNEFGYDGALNIITRAGGGVADQWSPWTFTPDVRPYPYDVDTVNNPLDHEAYSVFTLTGAVPVTGPPPAIRSGDVGFSRYAWDSSFALLGTVPISPPQGPVPPFPKKGFARVSAALVNTRLRVCAIARGDIWIETRDRTADRPQGEPEDRIFLQQWARPESALGDREFVDVACASVWNPAMAREDLHVFGVTKDGHLLRSISPAERLLRPWVSSAPAWEDIEASFARDVGEIRHVDAASRRFVNQLAIVASTEDGRAWYFESRGGSNSVTDIVAGVNATTAPFSTLISVGEVAAGFCDADVPPRGGSEVEWELNILLEDQDRTRLLHTIRAGVPIEWSPPPGGVVPSPSQWKPFTDILAGSGRSDPTGKRRLDTPTIGEFPVKSP
jgi:hypothetical protein